MVRMGFGAVSLHSHAVPLVCEAIPRPDFDYVLRRLLRSMQQVRTDDEVLDMALKQIAAGHCRDSTRKGAALIPMLAFLTERTPWPPADLEIAKILSLLVVCGKDVLPWRKELLDTFSAFFRTFPESPSHPHVLAAFNCVLLETAPNALEESLAMCWRLSPFLLKLWDSRQQALKIELVQHYRITCRLAVAHGFLRSDASKEGRGVEALRAVWKRVWADIVHKQPWFEPWASGGVAFSALWAGRSEWDSRSTGLALLDEPHFRTWMVLDLAARIVEILAVRDVGTTPAAQQPQTIISAMSEAIKSSGGNVVLMALQLVYVLALRRDNLHPLAWQQLGPALMDAISFEDSEVTSWALLALTTVLRNQGTSFELKDQWSKLAALCLTRLNSPMFSDAAAHTLAELLRQGFVDPQDPNLGIGWLETNTSDPLSSTRRFGTGLWRWHRARLDRLRSQRGTTAGEAKRCVQCITELTLGVVQSLIAAPPASRPDQWKLFNRECVVLLHELSCTWWELQRGSCGDDVYAVAVEEPPSESCLRELDIATSILRGELLHTSDPPSEVQSDYAASQSSDLLSFLQALRNTVTKALRTTRDASQDGAGAGHALIEALPSTLSCIWIMGLLARISSALPARAGDAVVARAALPAMISEIAKIVAESLASDFRSDQTTAASGERSSRVLQALSWAMGSSPTQALRNQMLDCGHRNGPPPPRPNLWRAVESDALAHLLEAAKALVPSDDRMDLLGKRKRSEDDDFAESGGDRGRQVLDISSGQLMALVYRPGSADLHHDPERSEFSQSYASSLYGDAVLSLHLGTGNSNLLMEAWLDDLISFITPGPFFDSGAALEAVHSLVRVRKFMSETHVRRLNAAIGEILRHPSLQEDAWSFVLVLRIAHLILLAFDPASEVTENVKGVISELMRMLRFRIEKKPIGRRVRLEFASFLLAALDRPQLSRTMLTECWDASIWLKVLHDSDLYVRWLAGTGAGALLASFPSVVDGVLQGPAQEVQKSSTEERVTYASFLTLLAVGASSDRVGRALARLVQIPGSELQPLLAVCMARLASEWRFPNPHDCGRRLFPTLLHYWLVSGAALQGFPINLLGYQTFKALLDENKQEVIAQLLATGRDEEFRFVEAALQSPKRSLLEASLTKAVAYVALRAAESPTALEQRLHGLMKELDPDSFSRRLKAGVDEIFLNMLLSCKADEPSATSRASPPPEAEHVTKLRSVLAGTSSSFTDAESLAPYASRGLEPRYSWRRCYSAAIFFRQNVPDFGINLSDPAYVAWCIDRMLLSRFSTDLPGEADDFAAGFAVLLALSEPTVVNSGLCVQVALQALAELATTSSLSVHIFIWLVGLVPHETWDTQLSQVLMTLANVLTKTNPSSAHEVNGVYVCIRALLSRSPRFDARAARQMWNVAACMRDDGRTLDILRQLALARRNDMESDLASLALLGVRSQALLTTNIADVLGMASKASFLVELRSEHNAALASRTLSVLSSIATNNGSPERLKASSIRALSAIGIVEDGSRLTVGSAFSFGYRSLLSKSKDPIALSYAPIYAHVIALLLDLASDSGLAQVSLHARDALRMLLRDPNLKLQLPSFQNVAGYVTVIKELGNGPPVASRTKLAAADLSIPSPDSLSESASKTHDAWLVAAFESLAPHTYSLAMRYARDVVRLNPRLAEELLPFVVFLALVPPFDCPGRMPTNAKEVPTQNKDALVAAFKTFFGSHEDQTPAAISNVIRILLFLRAQRDHPQMQEIKSFVGSLDSLEIAKMFATALLFLEQVVPNAPDLRRGSGVRREGRDMVLKIFENLDADNFDAMQMMYGDLSLFRPTELSRRFEHERQWFKSLGLTDATGGAQGSRAVARSLAGLGLFNTLSGFLQGKSDLDSTLSDIQAEAAWRTGCWNEEADMLGGTTFNAQFHRLMDSLADLSSRERISSMLERIYTQCSDELTSTGIDSWAKVASIARKGLLAREVEEMTEVLSRQREMGALVELWQLRLSVIKDDWAFSDVEPLLSARTHMLLIAKEADATAGLDVDSVRDFLCSHQAQFVRLARKAGSTQLAVAQLATLHKELSSVPRHSKLASEWDLATHCEEAKALWAWDERSLAIRKLETLLGTALKNSIGGNNVSPIRCLLGRYVGAERLEQPLSVIDRYLLLSADDEGNPDRGKAMHELARYADEHIVAFRTSGRLEEAKARREQKSDEIAMESDQLKKMGQRDKNEADRLNARIKKGRQTLQQDDLAIADLEREERKYLELAIRSYTRSLALTDAFDSMDVSRLVSLWLSHAGDSVVNDILAANLGTVASHKFVGLVYQLSGRLMNSKDAFQNVLQTLLCRMVSEHPFHCLPTVFALRNADGGPSRSTDASASRSKAATAIFAFVLKAKSEATKLRAKQMEHLLLAYEELAVRDFAKYKSEASKPIPLAKEAPKLAAIHDYSAVPIVTRDMPVDKGAVYRGYVTVKGFGPDVTISHGGITMPKKVICIGSDGKAYPQLVKKDDVRQDAIFSTMFSTINGLLRGNISTRRRRLYIRTYKVFPLSNITGVLEWVEGSVPLGDWLAHAHARYRPRDLAPAAARKMISDAQKQPVQQRVETFRRILNDLKPVFRHFFEESYLDPQEWFDCRQTYTKSVATMAIVGWILGLGDRHVNNMLMDKVTGALVHIDFGIAFEMGKQLSVPETVPFRLTQDTIDGFGITGVEGLFRKSCEEVLALLRSPLASNMLLTLLDVLRYDPVSDALH
ncbi:hypothetical protein DFJ74DRAFT_666004 [Hyaloraphidium curvatum]|nr:hypothetical protein DFJ74DRAFT_666004 [Hyaloraphidium curvatum]